MLLFFLNRHRSFLHLNLNPQARVGVTSGMAYCGLVGASYRSEYALMGPAVNLAARLMCRCEEKGVNVLCNDDLRDKVMDIA